MAKMKRNLMNDPPKASSSEDDDVQTAEEDSSSEEESIKNSKTIPSATVLSAVKKDSDSESGSETETESDSDDTNPPKSGSGKSVSVAAVSAGKLSKEDSTSSVALPMAKLGTKRPAIEASPTTKRAKILTSGEEEESTKKPAFQRLWTEEDEVSVLQGMIDFKTDTGKFPYEDTNGFYEIMKKSISFEVSKNQFMDKIRSLRKKFMDKEGKNGAEPSFTKAHDHKTYKLSKVIWGPDGIALESSIKSNGVSKKSESKKKKLDSVKQELVFVGSPNGKKIEEDEKVFTHGGGLTNSDWFEYEMRQKVSPIASHGTYVNKHTTSSTSIVKVEEEATQLQASVGTVGSSTGPTPADINNLYFMKAKPRYGEIYGVGSARSQFIQPSHDFRSGASSMKIQVLQKDISSLKEQLTVVAGAMEHLSRFFTGQVLIPPRSQSSAYVPSQPNNQEVTSIPDIRLDLDNEL